MNTLDKTACPVVGYFNPFINQQALNCSHKIPEVSCWSFRGLYSPWALPSSVPHTEQMVGADPHDEAFV